jgi:hypothetical protein
MKILTTLGAASLLAAGVLALTPAPAPAYASPIGILSCTVAKPKAMSQKAGGTDITFVNHGPKTAKSIKFAVGYINSANPRGLLRSVVDEGTFSPGTTIKHHYALYNDVTYSGSQTHGCAAVKIIWSDGTTWTA